jgi:hypothetical protein
MSADSNITHLPLRPRKSSDPTLFPLLTVKEFMQRADGDEEMLVDEIVNRHRKVGHDRRPKVVHA